MGKTSRVFAILSSCSMLLMSSCAGLTIKTWYLDAIHEQSLIRKRADGTISEKLSFVEAQGYRCYSVVDDEAWRTRLAECCAKALGTP